MYSRTTVDELDERDIEGIEPGLKAVGYELRPEEMRPSVWSFDEGESNNRHRHDAQEELYFVVDGRFEMDVGDETFEVGAGEFVVVDPDAWRQLTALTESTLFVVGAPNVEGDAVTEE
ncbi:MULTISPECIES: cupin domain-containing protein [Halostella]|uniref:cupin domain-containing protein n=1 Tax=Halostella TaxID=1843185 RepID=UPI001080BA29|nr:MULTISPECIES: cupin domain-containing protein [Halostella]